MRMVNSEYKTHSNIRQIWYLKEYGPFIQKYLISTFNKEKIMHLPQTRKTCKNKDVLWYHTMEKHVPPLSKKSKENIMKYLTLDISFRKPACTI